jgi:D-galactose 1-dehydrogenase
MPPIRVAIVGLGKIARDQHVPALAADPAFTLAATVSPDGADIAGMPAFDTLDALLARGPQIDAVALCTPPQVRTDLAAAAIARGLHVLLEKPPAVTSAQANSLLAQAEAGGTTVFAAWHSRFAAGVAGARTWLAVRRIERMSIVWREDVRTWHPGQEWIWREGGFGVFDPGINALSIATAILPTPLTVTDAVLEFPSNRQAPIAARISMADGGGAVVDMDLDWRQTGPQTWNIAVDTDAGTLTLSHGGAVLSLPHRNEEVIAQEEYPALYARFAELIRAGERELDTAPLRLVEQAMTAGQRRTVDPFDD